MSHCTLQIPLKQPWKDKVLSGN